MRRLPTHWDTCSAQVLALIMAGTSLTGLCSVLLGKLGVGKAGSQCRLDTVWHVIHTATASK